MMCGWVKVLTMLYNIVIMILLYLPIIGKLIIVQISEQTFDFSNLLLVCDGANGKVMRLLTKFIMYCSQIHTRLTVHII